MDTITFPITLSDKNKLLVKVDMQIYAKESLNAACYKFTNKFYIHQQTSSESDKIINVFFESQNGDNISEEIVKSFCNELIDQQVRFNTNLQFGHIRDLIVEEAFKPVNK